MNWRLDVRQAAFVQTDAHADDLYVLHRWFAEWLGPGRLVLDAYAFRAFAETEREARRFEAAAKAEIAERDLFLVTSLHRRDGPGSEWDEVEAAQAPVSDAEVEAELARFLDDARDD